MRRREKIRLALAFVFIAVILAFPLLAMNGETMAENVALGVAFACALLVLLLRSGRRR
jgi:uncharacterized membrane protein